MACIVVIDDDEDLRRHVQFHLERAEHSVFCARDSFEGIELIESTAPTSLFSM